MIYGTAYFPSRTAAEAYYTPYHYADVRRAVQRKIDEGAIHIGPPPLKPGEHAFLIDDGTRYAIEDKTP